MPGGRIKFQISTMGSIKPWTACGTAWPFVMARDLFARLASGKEVPWTAGYVLAPDGLVCPRRLFGRPRLVPYSELQSPVMNDGFLFLFTVGKRKHFASIRVSSENFFPGLVVLNRAVAPGTTRARERQPGRSR